MPKSTRSAPNSSPRSRKAPQKPAQPRPQKVGQGGAPAEATADQGAEPAPASREALIALSRCLLDQLAIVKSQLVLARGHAAEAKADARTAGGELRRLLRHVEKHAREAACGVECATYDGPLARADRVHAPGPVRCDPMWQLARTSKALRKLVGTLQDDGWHTKEAVRRAQNNAYRAEMRAAIAADHATTGPRSAA